MNRSNDQFTSHRIPTTPPVPRAPVTSAQMLVTFVPFGIGLIAAMLMAEATQNLRLFRTIYSIRASLLLALPALALFPFRHDGPTARNLWRLFWSFSFLAYTVHLAYAWFGVFGGQVQSARLYPELFHVAEGATEFDLVVAHQGKFVAWSNLVVSGLWFLDVVLAWLAGRARAGFGGKLVNGIHGLTWLYVLVSFLVATVYFYKNPVAYTLGWVLAGSTAAALVARLVIRPPSPAAPVGIPAPGSRAIPLVTEPTA